MHAFYVPRQEGSKGILYHGTHSVAMETDSACCGEALTSRCYPGLRDLPPARGGSRDCRAIERCISAGAAQTAGHTNVTLPPRSIILREEQ